MIVQRLGGGNEDWNNDRSPLNVDVNTDMRDRFKAFCCDEKIRKKFGHDLTPQEHRGVDLLEVMRRTKAPLDAYDETMLWHYRSTGKLGRNEGLKEMKHDYIGRKTLIDRLKKRYNMHNKFATKRPIVLPFSKQLVDLVCHDAWGCVESLLTDPRVTDDDYLFFDDDPTATPPESMSHFGDLNTGKAYREAVKKYKQGIKSRVILPIVIYIDGADTGSMKNMPITAVKIALGIHNRKYRDLDQAWRTLGYVASVKKPKAQGKKIYKESKHIAAQDQVIKEGEGEEEAGQGVADKDAGKQLDFHAMLDVIFESFRDVQRRGFMWDLRYRGKTWENLEFVPFVCFVKCDNKEADTLCGSYNSYNKGVAQLCRYCDCPNEESDNPAYRGEWKRVSQIKPLNDAQDLKQLKQLSQHCIEKAMYKLRFSPALLERGIHGASPSELLHQVLLGIFLRIRDTFFMSTWE